MSDEIQYRLLKLLEEHPLASQRQLAEALGFSLGKVNYCMKALIDKGWIKATNFKNSNNKLAYIYLLTRGGVNAKTLITARFLKQKIKGIRSHEAGDRSASDRSRSHARGSKQRTEMRSRLCLSNCFPELSCSLALRGCRVCRAQSVVVGQTLEEILR